MVRLYDAPGLAVPLRSHRPPEPFGKHNYKQPETPGVEELNPENTRGLSYDEITFAHHPRERHEPSIIPLPDWFADDQVTARLKIESMLSVGISGTQVVLCSVVNAPTAAWEKMGQDSPKLVVAKIFDPYYYHDTCTPDMVAAADREYAQEAVAYIRMHSERLAKNPAYMDKPDLVPGFYGTWTTDITRDHLRKSFMSPKSKKNMKRKEAFARKKAAMSAAVSAAPDLYAKRAKLVHSFRPVRIILLEYIGGSTVSDLCIKKLDWCPEIGEYEANDNLRPLPPYESQEKRLQIFHNIMDTGSRIGRFGITHFKRFPTSFIVKESDNRVVMTDFSRSDTWSYTDVGYHVQQKLPKPIHPMTLCDIDKWFEFSGWFPSEWLDDKSLFDAWGEKAFAQDQYTDDATLREISKKLDWVNTLKKVGRLRSLPGESTYTPKSPPVFLGIPKEREGQWKAMAIAMGNMSAEPTPEVSSIATTGLY